MARAEIDVILGRGEVLAQEINQFVPLEPKSTQFRADLAGLLVVALVASYETCVKETLIAYAGRYHNQFATFAQNNFDRLNSKIGIDDLYKYARIFDANVHTKFGVLVTARTNRLKQKLGVDCKSSYKQLLSWRHDFAHAGLRNTTVEEAIRTHLFAKRIIYTFDDAFAEAVQA